MSRFLLLLVLLGATAAAILNYGDPTDIAKASTKASTTVV